MRRAGPLFAVLALAGCGGGKIVEPLPVKVVGPVPTAALTTTESTTTATPATTGGPVSGTALFASKGCNACHTYKPAGPTAVGKIGPDLDKLAQYAKQAKQPLQAFVRESIVNPNAYVQPGYTKGIMPSFAGLPKAEIDALVTFLTKKS